MRGIEAAGGVEGQFAQPDGSGILEGATRIEEVLLKFSGIQGRGKHSQG